jgi:hypothetical protein
MERFTDVRKEELEAEEGRNIQNTVVSLCRGSEAKMALSELRGWSRKWTPLYTLGHFQPQFRPPHPLAQVRAAVAQVGDRNWNFEKKILCSTTRVFLTAFSFLCQPCIMTLCLR